MLKRLLCLLSFLVSFSLSNAFADTRIDWGDAITFTPGGTLSDVQQTGDLDVYASTYRPIVIIYPRMVRTGMQTCEMGPVTGEEFSSWFSQQCTGYGTISLTYTSSGGKACHITLRDSSQLDHAEVVGTDCGYSLTYNYNKSGSIMDDYYFPYTNILTLSITEPSFQAGAIDLSDVN